MINKKVVAIIRNAYLPNKDLMVTSWLICWKSANSEYQYLGRGFITILAENKRENFKKYFHDCMQEILDLAQTEIKQKTIIS